MKSRIIVLFIFICGLWGILLLRAGYLQFLPQERLQALQNRQFQTVVTLQSQRGAIFDKEGRGLALSTTAYSIYADPKLVLHKKQVAKQLAKELKIPVENIYAKIKDSSKRFVWIQRALDKEAAEAIKALQIKGLSFVEEWKRIYPNENLLAHTLGFLGIDGQALEGLELAYDEELRGSNKKVSVKKDARGRPLIADGLLFTENPEGNDLNLTIDAELQYALDRELAQVVSTFEANSAVGIVLDAETSAIRAISNAPTFDPNYPFKASAEHRRNRAITDSYEPGSTMKSFLMATALRDKLINPESRFFCENGSFKVGDKIIREADSHHHFGYLSASEILAYSSNIGSTKIAFQMGAEKYRQGLLDLGFGSKLGIEISGEAKGMVQPLPWRPHLLSNISFGHGISATPLQIANAYAAIANGGNLYTPYLVQSIKNNETGEVRINKPKFIRKVFSEEVAIQLRKMLVGVTEGKGTGLNARVDGFEIGGKTGTAQKVNPNGRGYLPGGYISSFGGFFPANKPKYVIYIAVDQPRKAYYGSEVAAPIFSKIASYIARKDGLTPSKLAKESPKKYQLATSSEASEKLNQLTMSDVLRLEDPKLEEFVPQLQGLALRDVIRKIHGKDLKLKIQGDGVVAEMYPSAGSVVPENKEIKIILK